MAVTSTVAGIGYVVESNLARDKLVREYRACNFVVFLPMTNIKSLKFSYNIVRFSEQTV